MTGKKYFWLKLKKDFFKRHDIQIIESMPNGKDYILFYLKMLVESANDINFVNKNHKAIAYETNYSIEFVENAINTLTQYGLLRKSDVNTFVVPYITKETVLASCEETGRDRTTPEYKLWRINVFERDLYTCKHCQAKGVKLNAHHIKSWKNHIKLRFDVSNGITLCEVCHKKEHKRLRGIESGRTQNVCENNN